MILKAEVPVVVAVTKADLVDSTKAPGVIGRQLLELGLATEEYGGDAPVVAVSAKVRHGGRRRAGRGIRPTRVSPPPPHTPTPHPQTGMGLQDLKEAIALVAELQVRLRRGLSAPPCAAGTPSAPRSPSPPGPPRYT